jgi:type I restriction enzyme S subunit
VKYFFESGYYWEQIEDKSVGTGQPNVNGTLLGELQIPIPPLAEQHRIVERIEGIFQTIDSIQNDL